MVLHDLSMSVGHGKVTSILGHNGAGKSTLLKALFNLIERRGRIELDSQCIDGMDQRALVRRGMAYVPQGCRVLTRMTVRENLEIAGFGAGLREGDERFRNEVSRLMDSFPALSERFEQEAGTLSGGEKQMLALCCALVTSPRVLLLDEPSHGLSPERVTACLNKISEINQVDGITVVLVEQRVRLVLSISDYTIILRNGKISYQGRSAEIRDDVIKESFL